MSILSLKSDLLIPERETIINKSLTFRQKSAVIASITEQAGVINLWVFQQIPDLPFTGCGFISEVTIQGIRLQTSGADYRLIENDPSTYMKLQHLIEKGVDLSPVENVSFNKLVLVEYRLSEGTVFPEIDTEAEMSVSLKTREESSEILIEPPHRFNLKIGEHDISRSFIDPSCGKEITYHISELICDDIWKHAAEADMTDSLEFICPKGHALLILMYECTEDVQLNFCTTEALIDTPNSSCASAIGFIGFSGKETRFGNQVRPCSLNSIPIGFDSTIEIELTSWYKKIPGETIEA